MNNEKWNKASPVFKIDLTQIYDFHSLGLMIMRRLKENVCSIFPGIWFFKEMKRKKDVCLRGDVECNPTYAVELFPFLTTTQHWGGREPLHPGYMYACSKQVSLHLLGENALWPARLLNSIMHIIVQALTTWWSS
jgi:hypothetical protein